MNCFVSSIMRFLPRRAPKCKLISSYGLRNANNLKTIETQTSQYYIFLPSVIRQWSSLSEEIRIACSINSFKSRLDQNIIVPEIPKYFYIGDRRPQILPVHLLTNYSSLNPDRFVKIFSYIPSALVGVRKPPITFC